MTKTSEFARALENAIDELKEKGYADDDVILDCEGNEITQNEIVCSLLAEQVEEALEKQIPKKPIEDRYPWAICSTCGGSVHLKNVQEHIQNQEITYCEHCGQALDWSDTR